MKEPLRAAPSILRARSARPKAGCAALVKRVERVIHEEMAAWGLGGVAVAMVDDQRLIYSGVFGQAKSGSIFRVGSISKLFNAIAVMQQVQAGHLDLDAPLPDELLPINPFPRRPGVTLRQILGHRSGLPRETPIGGYFDSSQPGLAATVASLRSSVLVTRPGEKTRYSNAAPSLAGLMVERASGQSFEEYQREHLLGPMNMKCSSWRLANTPQDRLVPSHLRVADGRGGWTRRDSPLFDLGTIPAGNLFSTAEDLARFAATLLANGAGLLKPGTLNKMWRPQFTRESTGYGLGFNVGRFREHEVVGHNGAVYGFSSSFVLLPKAKLAAIVLCNEDIANGRVHRMSDDALSLLLEAKFGEKPPRPSPIPLSGDLAGFTGEYESQSYWARLGLEGGRLIGEISGQPTEFAPASEMRFTARSRIEDNTPVEFERNRFGTITGFRMGIQEFARVTDHPANLPREWRAYLGSYGPDFMPLVVSERHGHLYAMTENMVDYRLTPLNCNVCALPPGMYADEQVVFLAGRVGPPQFVNFANMLLRRRELL